MGGHSQGRVASSLSAVLLMLVWVFAIFGGSITPASAEVAVADVPSFRGNAARGGGMQGSGPTQHLSVLWAYGEDVSTTPVSDDSSIYVGTTRGDVVAIDAASGVARWRRPIGSDVMAGPAVANGVVFAASYENLFALEAATGTPLWQAPFGGTGGDTLVGGGLLYVAGGDGVIRAFDVHSGEERWQATGGGVLAIAEETLYAAGGTLAALDAATGDVHWEFSPITGLSALSIAIGQSVYVSGYDGNVYAVDPATGAEQWWFSTGSNAVLPPQTPGDVIQIGSSEGRIYGVDTISGSERWRTDVGSSIVGVTAAAGILFTVSGDGSRAALDATSGVLKWRVDGSADSTEPGLLLASGSGYLVSGGTLRAWDPATGAERWLFGTPIGPGIVVSDRSIIVGGDDGRLHAIDALTGVDRWSFATGGPVRSWPAVMAGIVYAGSDDGYLYALAVDSGLEQWRFRTGGAISGPLAVIDETVYFTSGDGQLYALEAGTGALRWRVEASVSGGNPLAADGRAVYLSDSSSYLTAYDAANGTYLWQSQPEGGPGLFPVVADDIVYVANGNGFVHAFSASDGMQRWQFSPGTGIFAGLTVVNGGVFFESDNGNFYALDALTGEERWTYPAGGSFDTAPAFADGTLYATTGDGDVNALDADDGSLLWRGSLTPFGLWAPNPIIAGDLLLTFTNDQLYAVGPARLGCGSGILPSRVDERGRLLVVGGGSDLLSAPGGEASVVATLPDGTILEGMGPGVDAAGSTLWPVRDLASGSLGYVLESSLASLDCAENRTFAPPIVASSAATPAALP